MNGSSDLTPSVTMSSRSTALALWIRTSYPPPTFTSRLVAPALTAPSRGVGDAGTAQLGVQGRSKRMAKVL
jgi:hypothetical protein